MSLAHQSKNILIRYPFLLSITSTLFNKTLGSNKIIIKGKTNKISGLNNSFLRKSRIRIVGIGNEIRIEDMSYLQNCDISIFGNNNKVAIGTNVYCIDGDFHIEDDNNVIKIGDFTSIYGYTHVAAIEGKQVLIGKECLFSKDVIIRTGDSHSIIDNEGFRINPSENVIIGDHVWLSNKSTILKGAKVQSNSIVGTGALVTKVFTDENVIIAGNPAKIVKENINWLKERIRLGQQ